MKKNTFLVMILLIISSTGFSQLSQGNCFLAGYSNLGLDIGTNKNKSGGSSTGDYNYAEFFITPEAGYFIADNFMVGGFLDLDLYHSSGTSEDKYSKFIIGPNARYYFMQINKFNLYGELRLGVGTSKEKYSYGGGTETTIKKTYYTARLGPGCTYFLTDNLGLDLFAGYDYDLWSQVNDDSGAGRSASSNTKTQDIWSSLEVNVGFVFVFDN
jgi:hypothetical protein